jgi:hypothetical protein
MYALSTSLICCVTKNKPWTYGLHFHLEMNNGCRLLWFMVCYRFHSILPYVCVHLYADFVWLCCINSECICFILPLHSLLFQHMLIVVCCCSGNGAPYLLCMLVFLPFSKLVCFLFVCVLEDCVSWRSVVCLQSVYLCLQVLATIINYYKPSFEP